MPLSFKHLPAVAKVLLLLSALGAVSVFALVFANSQMSAIGHSYNQGLTGSAQGTTALARANRHTAWTARSILKLIISETPDEIAKSNEDIAKGQRAFQAEIANAIARMPEQKARLEGFRDTYGSAMATACGETITLGKAGQRDAAIREMNSACSPRLISLMSAMTSEVDANVAANERLAVRLEAQTRSAQRTTAMSVLTGLVLVFAVAFWLTRSGLSLPMRRLDMAMASISRGELTAAVPGLDRKDELGAMAQTVEQFRLALEEAERLRHQAADQERQTALRVREERLAIADAFETSMGAIASAFVHSSSEVSDAAQSLAATAEETSRQAQVVSGAAEEAAANVQTVAAATEEMSSSVQEINSQVSQSAGVARAAVSDVAVTETEIQTLTEAASGIGEVVKLISDIAAQTNLLALNATIEAARAGDAGKGFAVVASEVKDLATQTSRATKDISTKIEQIQQATNRSVQSIGKIVTTIGDIQSISSIIAAAVEQQGAATHEIAGNTARAAQGTQEVTENIFGVGRAAEMTGAASTQLMALSGNLSSQAYQLQDEVSAFVTKLRAA
jgi:methyl-accepting chemotaxis protein